MRMVRAGFRTNSVDHCTRLCHSTSVAAMLNEPFYLDLLRRSIDDVPITELSYDDRRVLLQHAVLISLQPQDPAACPRHFPVKRTHPRDRHLTHADSAPRVRIVPGEAAYLGSIPS